ncbi:MAG TPA: DUF6220 domain-containing protein [Bacillales bacterium]|nr:DUF6220 domain-containing protein [Bacillales bacterium]
MTHLFVKIFAGLSALFAGCVLVQIFFAGLAVFGQPTAWLYHTTFIHFFEMIPVLMLICAFIARLPGRLRWMSVVLIALIFVQYLTANLASTAHWIGALHPIIAFMVLGASLNVTQQSIRAAWGKSS